MPESNVITAVNLILYSAALVMALYIGKKRPAWRLEMSGAVTAILLFVGFYALKVADMLEITHVHAELMAWIGSFLSMLSGGIACSYGFVMIVYLRKQNGK